jgi:hypothetical protein
MGVTKNTTNLFQTNKVKKNYLLRVSPSYYFLNHRHCRHHVAYLLHTYCIPADIQNLDLSSFVFPKTQAKMYLD